MYHWHPCLMNTTPCLASPPNTPPSIYWHWLSGWYWSLQRLLFQFNNDALIIMLNVCRTIKLLGIMMEYFICLLSSPLVFQTILIRRCRKESWIICRHLSCHDHLWDDNSSHTHPSESRGMSLVCTVKWKTLGRDNWTIDTLISQVREVNVLPGWIQIWVRLYGMLTIQWPSGGLVLANLT